MAASEEEKVTLVEGLASPALLREMWQFQPLSRPIFSENTRDRSSLSRLKWTNLRWKESAQISFGFS